MLTAAATTVPKETPMTRSSELAARKRKILEECRSEGYFRITEGLQTGFVKRSAHIEGMVMKA